MAWLLAFEAWTPDIAIAIAIHSGLISHAKQSGLAEGLYSAEQSGLMALRHLTATFKGRI